MTESKLNRGNVWWVNLEPVIGSEIKKIRPCVLVGASPINEARRTVLVVPLSSSQKPHPPISIRVQCMGKDGLAACDQLRAVDKSRLTNWIEALDRKSLESIDKALQQVLALW